jgi:hypothetical protein
MPGDQQCHTLCYPHRSTVQVEMVNVTLVLPVADYAALLSAALRGANWKSGAIATLALFQVRPGASMQGCTGL